jgi:Flp pilus assembly protein TadB
MVELPDIESHFQSISFFDEKESYQASRVKFREHMSKCPFCSAENSDEAQFCSSCGKIIATKTVPVMPTSSSGMDVESQSFILLSFAIFVFMFAFMIGIVGVVAEPGFLIAALILSAIGVLLLAVRYLIVRSFERKVEKLQAEFKAELEKKRQTALIKVKCHYCGGLNSQTDERCGFCGAPL